MLHKSIVKKSVLGKGEGLFATKRIKANEVVWAIDDSCKIFPLKKEIKQKYPRAYLFGNKYVVCNDDSDYMNHSCGPNTWWTSDRQLSARRDIRVDEEITYDYSTTDVSPDWVADWKCKCGSVDCRKRISNRDCLREDFQQKYGEHLPSWTKEFIRKNRARSDRS